MAYTWYKIDELTAESMTELKLTEVIAGGKRVGLIKKQGSVYAFAATCPHAGVALCDGWVDGMGRIVCPLHKYRFDPANGRNTSGEGYKLFTYPVELREEGIFIGLLT